MKKFLISLVVIVIVIVGIVFLGKKSNTLPTDLNTNVSSSTVATTPDVPAIETTKVSGKTSKFQNAELGFAVNYPTTWEAQNTDTGVTFVMPIDKSQVSTISKLQSDISVSSGKCAFPPITTIKDRGTITVGSNTLNMITMSNSVQGRAYWDRMYSLDQGGLCYLFHFASIALSPASKNLTGSNLTQAQNNNKAIVASSDADFTSMVKTFTFVQGPAGQDETTVSPTKK